jgi:putative RNA 2'-phosphotransferase
MNYVKLSKEISYALRHAPWEYELELDDSGWVDLNQLIGTLKLDKNWQDLTINHIEEMIETSEKKRHEILDGKIRALYGHSTPNRIKIQEYKPPEFLYHGTVNRFLDQIKKNGLLPKSRQYVHLSTDIKTAQLVGKRRDKKPIILKIYSGKAYEEGIKFYHGNENIWLADKIESKYIEFNS